MSETGEGLVREELLEYFPLTPAVFHIMLSLAAGERHGYAIMKEVDEQTDGEIRLGTGKLYYSIQRMLDEALIEEIAPDDDQKPERGRRTYRLTDLGRALCEAEALRLHKAVRLAQRRSILAERETEPDRAG